MVYRFAVISAVGGKQEREKLLYRGDHGFRARMITQDILTKYENIDGILITGMSDYQMKHVDSYMLSRGYKKIISPDFMKQKDKWRFTCLTAAYVKERSNQIRYNEEEIDTIYRYVAFSVPGDIEIRLVHVPGADSDKPNYDKQLQRKRAMLAWEEGLEKDEISVNKKVISCGDWNTEIGNMECHDLFDKLTYEKLLDEITWGSSKIDNVLCSPCLSGKVKAYTDDYRWGQTSDHKTVLFEVRD